MTTKTVSIQGYDSAQLGGARRSRSRKAGGGGGGAMTQVAANSGDGEVTVSKVIGSPVGEAPLGAPISSIGAPLRGGGTAPVPAINITAAPTMPAPATLTAAAAPTAQQGGAKAIRVELKKSTTQKKVHLNPKRDGPIHVHKKDKTKKNRRITLGLVGLHKRLTRAKKIHHRVKEMPLAELKAQLIKRGLIKESSKAPESVIRQIAADAQIVVGSAL
jgi:hypothetical protein